MPLAVVNVIAGEFDVEDAQSGGQESRRAGGTAGLPRAAPAVDGTASAFIRPVQPVLGARGFSHLFGFQAIALSCWGRRGCL